MEGSATTQRLLVRQRQSLEWPHDALAGLEREVNGPDDRFFSGGGNRDDASPNIRSATHVTEPDRPLHASFGRRMAGRPTANGLVHWHVHHESEQSITRGWEPELKRGSVYWRAGRDGGTLREGNDDWCIEFDALRESRKQKGSRSKGQSTALNECESHGGQYRSRQVATAPLEHGHRLADLARRYGKARCQVISAAKTARRARALQPGRWPWSFDRRRARRLRSENQVVSNDMG